MKASEYSTLPGKPGVYIYKDKHKKVIYVGKAKDLRKRVTQYFAKTAHDEKTTHLVSDVNTIDYIIVNSEIEAFLLEAELIKKHKPYYNIRFADDKSYPFICISADKIPYVTIARKKTSPKVTYFGPYPDAGSAKIVLKLLRRIFPYQSVKNHPKKKCLYFHLGLCPCATAIPENLPTYKKNLRNFKKFLSGENRNVEEDLLKEQKEHIKKEEFEQAGTIQKQLDSIHIITQESYDPFIYLERPNIHVVREKLENDAFKKLLEDYLVPVGNLRRIECYDISNLSGTNATGSMVVLINGSVTKSEYKRFKIRSLKTPNDFAMHQEVMHRRMKHTEWETPNLLIIDGGKGQVSSVMQILATMGIRTPVIGLAKRFETLVIPQKIGNKIEFLEVRIPHSSPALNLARRIRDEAHRFAITYHRKLRSKSVLS